MSLQLHHHPAVEVLLTSPLIMRKPKHRQLELPAQGHTVTRWHSQYRNRSRLSAGPVHLLILRRQTRKPSSDWGSQIQLKQENISAHPKKTGLRRQQKQWRGTGLNLHKLSKLKMVDIEYEINLSCGFKIYLKERTRHYQNWPCLAEIKESLWQWNTYQWN